MDDLREFTFVNDPGRKPITWALQNGHVMRKGGAKAMRLADVVRAQWGDLTYRGTRYAWLELFGPDGEMKLDCRDAASDTDRRVFLDFATAVLADLHAAQPGFAVKTGRLPDWIARWTGRESWVDAGALSLRLQTDL